MALFRVHAIMPRVQINGIWEMYTVAVYIGDNWTDITPQIGNEVSALVLAEGVVSDLVLEAMQTDTEIVDIPVIEVI